jgi:hypothetical protein
METFNDDFGLAERAWSGPIIVATVCLLVEIHISETPFAGKYGIFYVLINTLLLKDE